MPMLWVLRDIIGLTGTKYGCGIGQCGACTILVNDHPIRSCSLPVNGVGRKEIKTIEGTNASIEKEVKAAWVKHQVPQCGYCQSGQIMSAIALLMENNRPTDHDINHAMRGNLCRCGTYEKIRKAIHHVSNQLNQGL